MAERFPDFGIQEIQELEPSENQNTKKITSTWLMSGPAEPKTRTLKPICSPAKRNNMTKINRWRYMTDFLRSYYKQILVNK